MKQLKVSKLEEGTVIDHLAAGTALRVLALLDLPASATVLMAMNVCSNQLGKKDILKIEDKLLTPGELDRISLIAPGATINMVKSGEIYEKRKVVVPDRVVGVLKCPNPNCVTNSEPVRSVFSIEGEKFTCGYCERSYPLQSLEM